MLERKRAGCKALLKRTANAPRLGTPTGLYVAACTVVAILALGGRASQSHRAASRVATHGGRCWRSSIEGVRTTVGGRRPSISNVRILAGTFSCVPVGGQ